MNITVEYKTPEKGSVEHKELDPDTEIKFIPDYEILDEEERKDLDDYFAKLNGFPKCQRCGSKIKIKHDDKNGTWYECPNCGNEEYYFKQNNK